MRNLKPAEAITGCILAGGEGRRLGCADKGLLRLGTYTLVEYCIQRMQPQVGAIMISANRNHNTYRKFATTIIGDSGVDFAGPLAGFLAAMDASSTPYIAMTACDSPFIPEDMVARLWQPIANGEADISVVRSGGRLQPVFALVPVELRDSLTAYLDAGQRKIAAWFNHHRLAEVEFEDHEAFANINTAVDLEHAARRLKLHDPVT